MGISVDGSGNVFVTGETLSSNFPTLNQHQTAQGSYDAFVAKLSFTSITVTSPNGGENWKQTSTQNITWNAVGITGNLKITLWKAGAQIGVIADNINPAAGSYSWTVGKLTNATMVAVGSDYKIKIKENGTAAADTSDGTITLIN